MLSILFENAPRKESNIGRNLAILGGLGALGAGGAILGSNLNKSSTTPVATSNTKNSVLPSNSDASIQTKDPNSYKQFMTNANDAHLRQSDGSIGSYTGPHLGDVIDAQERK